MANFDARINLTADTSQAVYQINQLQREIANLGASSQITIGEKVRLGGLERSLATVRQVENAVISLQSQLRSINAPGAGAIGDAFRTASTSANSFFDGLVRGNRSLSNTVAGLNEQSRAFAALAANISSAEARFNDYIQGAQAAQDKGLRPLLKQFEALQDFYERGTTGRGEDIAGTQMGAGFFQNLAGEVPQTLGALKAFQKELLRIRDLVGSQSLAGLGIEQQLLQVEQQILQVEQDRLETRAAINRETSAPVQSALSRMQGRGANPFGIPDEQINDTLNQRAEDYTRLQEALSKLESKKIDPLGISDAQINEGLNQRAASYSQYISDTQRLQQALGAMEGRKVNWASALGIRESEIAAQRAAELENRWKELQRSAQLFRANAAALKEFQFQMRAQDAEAYTRALLNQQRTLDAYADSANRAAEAASDLGYKGELPALRPAGFTNQDVRIKNLIDDQTAAAKIAADLQMKEEKILTDFAIGNIQRELNAEIDKIEAIQAARTKADEEWWAKQKARLDEKTRLDEESARVSSLPFLERRFGKQRSAAISEGLIGGAFPLLFGQGIGASVGGGLGGVLGGMAGGGLGFGLSLAGTTLGAELDKAVIKAGELNAAFLTVEGSYSKIREQGIQFTAELENQILKLKEVSSFEATTQLERGAIQTATGDINAAGTEGVAAAGAVLSATWNDTYKSIQTSLGIVASPFLFALNALLTPVKALFQGFNAIASGVAYIISKIPGIGDSIQDSNEKAYKLTKEYQDQIAEINKQINEASKLNDIQADQLGYLKQAVGLGQTDTGIMKSRAEAAKRAAENELEIQKIRRNNPSRTEEQRQKVNELITQQQRKYLLEESAIALTKAQEIYLEIQENNRKVAEQKKQYEQQYQDFVTERAREQADINLEASRKVQDARIKGIEQEIKFAKSLADERLRASQIQSEQNSVSRSLNAALSDDPASNELLNNIETAVEKWRIGRQQVENEAADTQRQLQLQLQKGEIEIQRYKYDMAIKIARTNENSQKNIARINQEINKQNEEVSRKGYLRQLFNVGLPLEREVSAAQRDADVARQALSSGRLTPLDTEFYKRQQFEALETLRALGPVLGIVNDLIQGKQKPELTVAKVPQMKAIPDLTAPSADVTRAERSVLNQINQTETLINKLKTVNGLKQEDLNLVEAIITQNARGLDPINQALFAAKQEVQTKQAELGLLLTGINPAIAEQVAQLEVTSKLEEKRVADAMALLKAYKDPALQTALAPAIEALEKVLNAIPDKAGRARAAIEQSQEKMPGMQIISAYSEAKQQLQDLATWENVAVVGAQSIGDAFGNAFREIAAGTASAQEILAGFFQNLANSFADMAAQMISQLIMLAAFEPLLKMFAGPSIGAMFAPGPSGFTFPGLFKAADGGMFADGIKPYADGGMFADGIKPFADGGIVDSPTLFKFADGGALSNGVMGEAGPEAIMPLSRGSDGRLGVEGGGGDVSVTVNVDASGSKVQGDDQKSSQLGRALAAAVREELLKQKRPGGLLQ